LQPNLQAEAKIWPRCEGQKVKAETSVMPNTKIWTLSPVWLQGLNTSATQLIAVEQKTQAPKQSESLSDIPSGIRLTH